jgi:hypothetical protein
VTGPESGWLAARAVPAGRRSLLLRFLVGIPVDEIAGFAGFIEMVARFEQGIVI